MDTGAGFGVRRLVTFATCLVGAARGGETAGWQRLVSASCTSRVRNGSPGFYGVLIVRSQTEREREEENKVLDSSCLHGRLELL